MTALLLHGIVRSGVPQPDGAPEHLRVEAAELVALATRVPAGLSDTGSEAAVERALMHHGLLSAYAAEGDVVPVRFGTAFSGKAALVAALGAEAAAFRARLDHLSGRVEYVLSVAEGPAPAATPSGDAASPDGGRSFLLAKRALRDDLRSRSARRAAFVRSLPEVVGEAAVELQPITSSRRDVLGRFALLVERDGARALLRGVETLGQEAATLGLTISLGGPGPCYAFAGEGTELGTGTQERVDA